MANGFGASARELSVEFGKDSAHYKLLRRKFDQALFDPDAHVREASQRYLARLTLAHNVIVGGAFLVGDYEYLPPHRRALYIHPEQFHQTLITGNEVYVVLENGASALSLAHLCDFSPRHLEAEGLSVHPFSFTAVRQAQQGPHP